MTPDEKKRLYNLEWQKRNWDKVLAAKRRWAAANPESAKAWREANPDKILKSQRAARERNPERMRAKSRRSYEARKLKRLAILAENGGFCVYCEGRGRVPGNKATTIDHIVPLVLGGTNKTDNLCGACKSCNSSKGARTFETWKASLSYSLTR